MNDFLFYAALASMGAFLVIKFILKRDEGFYFLVLWGLFATLHRALNHEWILAGISAVVVVIAVIGVRGITRKSSK